MRKSGSEASLGRATSLSYSQFHLEAQIGTGSFGTVFRATYKPNKAQCAIKRIDLESSDDDIEEIQREIAILAECNNHFITRYFGCFMYEFELWIVMEYLGAGSCLDLVKDIRPQTLPESAIAEIMNQVVQGLIYLHKSGKIHRDIKAANVLMSDTGEVKIADFGVAAQLSNNLSRRNTFVGTPFWMAPEVINELDYSFEADIWSLGITAIESAQGRPPWSHLHPMKALFSIPRSDPPKLDKRFSLDFQDFVSQCSQIDPRKRAPIADLAKHPFLERKNRQDLLRSSHQHLKPSGPVSLPSTRNVIPSDGSQTIDSTRGLHPSSTLASPPKRNSPKKRPTSSSSILKPASSSNSLASSHSEPSDISDSSQSALSPQQPASRTSTMDSQRTSNNFTTTEEDDDHNDDDDDWDFDTIKPQPSLEQILQNPPPAAIADVSQDIKPVKPLLANEYPTLNNLRISNSRQQHSFRQASISSINQSTLNQSTLNESTLSQSTSNTGTVNSVNGDTLSASGVNLVRIFHHAARKFKDPMLEDISDLLRSDPPTVGVENYLVKRIAGLCTNHESKHSKPGRDPIEQISLDKWSTEVREAHSENQ